MKSTFLNVIDVFKERKQLRINYFGSWISSSSMKMIIYFVD